MIQLRRNNLNMTNAALSQDYGNFPYLYLSEQFKDDFWNDLFNAQLTGSGNVRCSCHLKQLQSQLCISMPLRFKLFQDLTTAGHLCIMSLSSHFHIKSVWASFSLVQQLQQHFLSCDAVYQFFYRFQSF